MNDRELVLKWWDEAWKEGVWAGAWSKFLDGLTPEQAAWRPPGAEGVSARHSIWQIVEHMIFWRENFLGRLDGGPRPTEAELAERNFPEVREVTAEAWEGTQRRFERTQERMAAALRERGPEADPLMHFLPHDCYHFGQISYVRALLGLKPVA